MGVVQSCIKQRNSAPQIEYNVPTILKRKQIGKHPHKQNILIPPLSQLGEYHESLEQLELALQENNINFSIHKTATFNSSSANRQSISINPSLNLSLNTTIPNMLQPQINQNLQFQEQPQNKDEQINQKKQTYKDSQFKIRAEIQIDKKDSYARSLSSNSRAQKAQNPNNDESSISLKRDSETNTKKSILKNKKQIITNQLNRGVSLRQQQQVINDDTQSQRTSKSQKRVKFDPKIFRPKNTHFFQ
ncbi:unnamed protein product [Paramecium primaurelia]|uniref:Uncharacterized protein n=1 Tax=Paramecium primaurelia TaxID=5886 RepID=A0A8S1K002_PARPR|nr:unnamed protein product [Paramecium primaurelia]